jgi:hypothetical protein
MESAAQKRASSVPSIRSIQPQFARIVLINNAITVEKQNKFKCRTSLVGVAPLPSKTGIASNSSPSLQTESQIRLWYRSNPDF